MSVTTTDILVHMLQLQSLKDPESESLAEYCTHDVVLALSHLMSRRLPPTVRRWLPKEVDPGDDTESDPSIGITTLMEAATLTSPHGSRGELSEERALRICELYLTSLADELPPEAWIEIRSLLPAEIRHRFVPRAAQA